MSILSELFASSTAPTDWLNDPNLWGGSYGRQTKAGEMVSPENSMSLSAYFACVRNISEDLGKIPTLTYRRLENRGKDRATKHVAYRLLKESPNYEMSAMSFKETLTQHAVAWGGGFAEIERDGAGLPLNLWPIHPTRINLSRTKAGELVYLVKMDDHGLEPIPFLPANIFHVHGLGGDGTCGYMLSVLAKESIGLGLAMETFGSAFFKNGAAIGGVLTFPMKMNDIGLERIRVQWADKYEGASKAGKTIVADQGAKYERMGIPPDEAQFLESRKFQIEEICRWFRMPPHKIQHYREAQGWSTLEATNTDYVNDTLMPWMVRWEEEASRKLFLPNERDEYFAEFLVQGLMRGDTPARSAYYSALFGIGVLSQNDIRELENMNGIGPEGDTYYVPVNNLAPSAMASEGESQMDVEDSVDVESEPPDPADAADRKTAKAFAPIFDDAIGRVLRKEQIAACRAAKKHAGDASAFMSWMEKFYGELSGDVVDSLDSPCEAYAVCINVSPADVLSRFATLYIADAQSRLAVSFAAGTVEPDFVRWGNELPAIARQQLMTAIEGDSHEAGL